MKKFWHVGAYDSYTKAAAFIDYPEVPFGPMLREMIRPTDRVADIGCGFGIVSRFVAPLADTVIAIDQDLEALQHLEADCKALHITNIETLVGIWPKIETAPWDVAIAFYHQRFAESADQIDMLLKNTRRCGMITVQSMRGRDSFHAPMLLRLGHAQSMRSDCANGCYVKGRLEQADCTCDCRHVAHDFAQPVADLEEAVDFMMRQLRLEDSDRQAVTAMAPEFLEQRGAQWCIPITRYLCVIRFWKNTPAY